jgi:hypothetical protein
MHVLRLQQKMMEGPAMVTSTAAKPLIGRRIAVPDKNGDLVGPSLEDKGHRCSMVLSASGRAGA